jgi:hypothetical protein
MISMSALVNHYLEIAVSFPGYNLGLALLNKSMAVDS